MKKIAECACQGGNLVPVILGVPRTSRERGRLLGLSRQRIQPAVRLDVFGRNCPDNGDGTVCFINCTNQAKMNLYSFHPGSCGLAMCDGSAHMVSENIGTLPFCRMITYNGRAPVTDSAF